MAGRDDSRRRVRHDLADVEAGMAGVQLSDLHEAGVGAHRVGQAVTV